MDFVDKDHRISYLESELKSLATAIAKGECGVIHAIKAWRSATGSTLKDSKDYIDSFSPIRRGKEEDRISSLERRVERLERNG